jgi:hypothetical protein
MVYGPVMLAKSNLLFTQAWGSRERSELQSSAPSAQRGRAWYLLLWRMARRDETRRWTKRGSRFVGEVSRDGGWGVVLVYGTEL